MSRTACHRRAMKKEEEENGSVEKSPFQATLQTTMPPLGLGLGPILSPCFTQFCRVCSFNKLRISKAY